LDLIEKTESIWSLFSRHLPNHLVSIRDGKIQKNNFHEFDDIAINKTAKDRAIIENLIPELIKF
jgi:hypothetical protein